MRWSRIDLRCRGPRHPRSTKALFRIAKGSVLVALFGAFVALASTPANLQEALQAQRSLVAENPGDADLLNDLGNLLAVAGDFEGAAEAYHQALAISPNDVTSLYNLALVLMEQDNTKEARKTLESIVEMEPEHAWAHYQLGTLFYQQRNRSKALHHYSSAFSLDRSLTSPKVNPHIVENSMATEALLQIYVDESPSTQASRIYKEPGDVADLLLPAESSQPASEPAVETAPEAENQNESETRRYRASFPTTGGDTSQTESSAAGMPASTADPEVGARSTGGSIGTTTAPIDESPQVESSVYSDYDQESPRQIDDSTLDAQPSYRAGPADRGSSQDLGEPAGSSVGFTPGLQSTGQLELELVPATQPASTVSPT